MCAEPHALRTEHNNVAQQCRPAYCLHMIQQKQWPPNSPNLNHPLQISCLGSLFESSIKNQNSELKVALERKFQLLKHKQIRHFQILGFMYKFTHGLLPALFKDYFCTQSDIHTYNTRTASLSALGISFARTNRRKKSLRITGPSVE